MASGSQVMALVQSHIDGDNDRFLSVAMQVAAHEAKLGHGRVASELRTAIDKAKDRRGAANLISISQHRGELANLLEVSRPQDRLSDMVVDSVLLNQLQRVIREQRLARRITDHGLAPRRKLLLLGPPGTGKTMTASVLAGELGLQLLQVRLDGLIIRFMGETAAKLRQVFEATYRSRGVYLFDEFDAIGLCRSLPNDVGEIRRILNSFLLMIEQDHSHSLVIAAANHPDILDRALFRRFDDVLHYGLPGAEQAATLLRMRLQASSARVCWRMLGEEALRLSCADISRAANDALKDAILQGRRKCREAGIRAAIRERKELVACLHDEVG